MCINIKSNLMFGTAIRIVPLLPFLLLLFACQGNALKAGTDTVQPTMPGSNLEQIIEEKLNEDFNQTTNTQQLLSRQRRYLLFPEGSSFQVVFDEYICVVDYTNYLVLGITVALAWELPSKPPIEELEDILNKLEDGTIDISRNDTVSNITYTDDSQKQTQQAAPAGSYYNNSNYKPNYINLSHGGANKSYYNPYYSSSPVFRTPMHPSYKYADGYYRRPMAPARRKDYHFYYNSPGSSARNPFQKYTQSYSPAQSTRYPYWALSSHLKNKWGKQRISPYISGTRNSYYKQAAAFRKPKVDPPRHHQIYPVFGKRSLPDAANPHHRHRRSGVSSVPDSELSRLENIRIKYHRNSRQTLYGRIEKYLDKRGHSGHQCVLRTLCETGQKSVEQEPGSFTGELLRAIFTIPEPLDHEPVAYRDTHYDKAHAQENDCAILYPECKNSIWDAPFIQ